MQPNPEAIKTLAHWLVEREAVRIKKERGEAPPWTDDEIIANGRFCNVRREDDKVTRWIATHWRQPHAGDPDLFVAMAVARLTNTIPTLAEIGWPLPWPEREAHYLRVTADRMARGETVFGAAYVIPSGQARIPKAEHLAKNVFAKMWAARDWLRPKPDGMCLSFFSRLRQVEGIGDFLCGQITCDMKFAGPLLSAPDRESWAIWGPGSMRGLNLMCGREPTRPWKRLSEWRAAFDAVWAQANPLLAPHGLADLSATDRQSALCEISKYIRAQRGGRTKQKYRAEVLRCPI
jgi:alpha-glutamyl/putrescinyl thymine pyrophosphorylase clade 1